MTTSQMGLIEGQQPNFLHDVIEFLRPKIVEERRNEILKLAVAWVVEELKMYGALNNTDDVSCQVELHKCRAKLPVEGVETVVVGYQLLLTLEGTEPHHAPKEADCFFELNGETIVNLYMPGMRPDGSVNSTRQ